MSNGRLRVGARKIQGCRPSVLAKVTAFAAVMALYSCGGGGGGSQTTPPPPPAPNFNVIPSNFTPTIAAGTSAQVSVSIIPVNGFDRAVTVTVETTLSGVGVNPSIFQLSPGQSQQVNLGVAADVPPASYSLTISGTSQGISQTTTMSLAVTALQGTPGSLSLPRSRWVRTDAATIYPFTQNENWLAFDPNTNRIFEADPVSNRIMVVNDVTQTKIGEIIVPGAFGIDLSPDGSTLWVGTLMGDVYAVDPVQMAVTTRYPAAQIGPNGFWATTVLAMANGELALLGSDVNLAGIYSVGAFAIWDPSDNSIAIYGAESTTDAGCANSTLSTFERTGDRSLLILSSSPCTFNPVTGQSNISDLYGAYPVVSTPDGKSILVLESDSTSSSPTQVVVLDSNTLVQEQTIPVALGPSDVTSIVVSADSKTVYLAGYLVYAYDLASGQLLGWAPNPYVIPYGGGLSPGIIGPPIFEAEDSNGLLIGPMQEGVGLFDTQALKTGPAPAYMLNDYVTPGTGSPSGGTPVQLISPENLAGILFVQPNQSPASATGIEKAGAESGTQAIYSVVTPPGAPGVADVYGLGTDGSLQFVPEGFSYGPTILEAIPNATTADGGGTGTLYGYGFGYFGAEIAAPTIPPGLQVTIGGRPATISGYNPDGYDALGPPFQLVDFEFTFPAGSEGSSEDITVTTPVGTATLKNGMTYLPATQQFPLNGAALAQGVYDSTRQLYYFTDASEIQVFSRSQGWLNPIQVPAAPQGTTHRLWALSLSSDGSKLAVTDTGTKAVYLIAPGGSAAPVTFSVAGDIPYGVYVSNAGMIYVAGDEEFYKIDTNVGSLLTYTIPSMPFGVGNYSQIRAAATADASQVYFDSTERFFDIDTAADSISDTQVLSLGCYPCDDFAFSSDNSKFFVSGYLYDSNLNGESYIAMNLRESFNAAYVNGSKLSPDGMLLFAPSPNGIDVFDGRLGILLKRIALPVSLSANYDALVSDGTDDVLVAITGQTGNGVAVIDLSSIPEPAPLPYATAPEGQSRKVGAGSITPASGAPKIGGIPPAFKHVTNETGGGKP